MTEFNPCVLIPTYDNPATVRAVVERAGAFVPRGAVLVVDDGGGPEARAALDGVARDGLARVLRRSLNGGKGAAVKDGFRWAFALGFTHALQVDADGQHALEDVPRFLDEARAHPRALVLGAPVFDDSAPKARRAGRELTRFWTRVEAGGPAIADPMCGFRVYPLASALAADAAGDAMDFDPEIAVRLVWQGLEVRNLPTRVRYLSREQGGVSHFRMGRDNALITWMHTRLMLERIARALSPASPRPVLA